jgi:ferredoxin
MDAIIGMEGKGPSCEDLRDIGKIMVSDNAVEMDAVMAMMMGLEPSRVPMLRIAQRRGLGEISRQSIEIIGPVAPIDNFKLPPKVMRGPVGFVSWWLLTHLMTSRPVPVEEKCSKCGVCEQHCPVGAIKLNPYPQVNPEKCISCFCCMELCPNTALEVTNKVKRFRGKVSW